MSLEDYSKFIRLHLQAMRGDPQLLDASTFSVLNTPMMIMPVVWACIRPSMELSFGTTEVIRIFIWLPM
jgi:hypothetical protein